MKAISKFFSWIFGLLGGLILLAAVVVSLLNLNAQPKLLGAEKEADALTERLMQSVCRGDYASAGTVIYGQPDLGADREPSDAFGKLLWDAFLDSLSYEFAGNAYATNDGISRKVIITALEPDSVTASLGQRAQKLLEERVARAENLSDIYDENNNYREDLVQEVLREAFEAALAEDAVLAQYEITLNLIHADGQWWIDADQTLLKAISGGMA